MSERAIDKAPYRDDLLRLIQAAVQLSYTAGHDAIVGETFHRVHTARESFDTLLDAFAKKWVLGPAAQDALREITRLHEAMERAFASVRELQRRDREENPFMARAEADRRFGLDSKGKNP